MSLFQLSKCSSLALFLRCFFLHALRSNLFSSLSFTSTLHSLKPWDLPHFESPVKILSSSFFPLFSLRSIRSPSSSLLSSSFRVFSIPSLLLSVHSPLLVVLSYYDPGEININNKRDVDADDSINNKQDDGNEEKAKKELSSVEDEMSNKKVETNLETQPNGCKNKGRSCGGDNAGIDTRRKTEDKSHDASKNKEEIKKNNEKVEQKKNDEVEKQKKCSASEEQNTRNREKSDSDNDNHKKTYKKDVKKSEAPKKTFGGIPVKVVQKFTLDAVMDEPDLSILASLMKENDIMKGNSVIKRLAMTFFAPVDSALSQMRIPLREFQLKLRGTPGYKKLEEDFMNMHIIAPRIVTPESLKDEEPAEFENRAKQKIVIIKLDKNNVGNEIDEDAVVRVSNVEEKDDRRKRSVLLERIKSIKDSEIHLRNEAFTIYNKTKKEDIEHTKKKKISCDNSRKESAVKNEEGKKNQEKNHLNECKCEGNDKDKNIISDDKGHDKKSNQNGPNDSCKNKMGENMEGPQGEDVEGKEKRKGTQTGNNDEKNKKNITNTEKNDKQAKNDENEGTKNGMEKKNQEKEKYVNKNQKQDENDNELNVDRTKESVGKEETEKKNVNPDKKKDNDEKRKEGEVGEEKQKEKSDKENRSNIDSVKENLPNSKDVETKKREQDNGRKEKEENKRQYEIDIFVEYKRVRVVEIVQTKRGYIYKIDGYLPARWNSGPNIYEYLEKNTDSFSKSFILMDSVGQEIVEQLAVAGPFTLLAVRDPGWVFPNGEPIPQCVFDAFLRPENSRFVQEMTTWLVLPGLWNSTSIQSSSWLPTLGEEGKLPVANVDIYIPEYISNSQTLHEASSKKIGKLTNEHYHRHLADGDKTPSFNTNKENANNRKQIFDSHVDVEEKKNENKNIPKKKDKNEKEYKQEGKESTEHDNKNCNRKGVVERDQVQDEHRSSTENEQTSKTEKEIEVGEKKGSEKEGAEKNQKEDKRLQKEGKSKKKKANEAIEEDKTALDAETEKKKEKLISKGKEDEDEPSKKKEKPTTKDKKQEGETAARLREKQKVYATFIDGKKVVEWDIPMYNGVIHVINELVQRPDFVDISTKIATWPCINEFCFNCPFLSKHFLKFIDKKGLIVGRKPFEFDAPPTLRPDWVCRGSSGYFPPGWEYDEWKKFDRLAKGLVGLEHKFEDKQEKEDRLKKPVKNRSKKLKEVESLKGYKQYQSLLQKQTRNTSTKAFKIADEAWNRAARRRIEIANYYEEIRENAKIARENYDRLKPVLPEFTFGYHIMRKTSRETKLYCKNVDTEKAVPKDYEFSYDDFKSILPWITDPSE